MHHRLDGICDGVVIGELELSGYQARVKVPLAGKVHALFQNWHLSRQAVLQGKRPLPGSPPASLDHVIPRLGLPLKPLDLQNLVDVIQVLLGGEDLGVGARFPHVAQLFRVLVPPFVGIWRENKTDEMPVVKNVWKRQCGKHLT